MYSPEIFSTIDTNPNTSDDQIYNSVWFLSMWDLHMYTHKPCLYRRLFMRILKYCIRKGRWKWQNLKKQTQFCKKVLRSRDWSAVSTQRKVKETVSALTTYLCLCLLLWGLLVVVKQLVWFSVRDLEFFYSVAAMCNVAFPATFWQNDAFAFYSFQTSWWRRA